MTALGLPYAYADVDADGYFVTCSWCGTKSYGPADAADPTKAANGRYALHFVAEHGVAAAIALALGEHEAKASALAIEAAGYIFASLTHEDRLPDDFAAVHDTCDANEYVLEAMEALGLPLTDDGTDAWLAVSNSAVAIVDARLRAAAARRALAAE